MTETYSKSRQQAEIAFGNVQSAFFSKNNAMEELEAVAQLRAAKPCGFGRLALPKSKGNRHPRD